MKQVSINYAVVLYQLSIPQAAVDETSRLLGETVQLKQVLSSPVISLREKLKIIDRIFPAPMRAFLKVVCRNGYMDSIEDILTAYHDYSCERQGVLKAQLRCVTEPSQQQLTQMGQYLRGKFDKNSVKWTVTADSSLIGGFVIRVNDVEMDHSLKGRLEQLQQKLMWR